MKLIQVLDEAQILEEGIRFTNREISRVKKNSKNILVAFEYEFTPVQEKMDAVRRGETPTPSQETTPTEISIHDVHEYNEYERAVNELEQEMFNETMEDAKDKFIVDAVDTFRDINEESINFIDALSTKKTTFFNNQYPKIFRKVRNDLLGLDFSYKRLAQKLDDNSITEEELKMLASYIDIISEFRKTLVMSNYMGIIIDSDPEGLEEMYGRLWGKLLGAMNTPKNFIDFFTEPDNNYDDVRDFVENLNNVGDLPMFSEFGDPFQRAFVFDSLKQELSDVVDKLNDNEITFESIRTAISFLETLESVENINIDEDITDYAESFFVQERESIEENVWETVINSNVSDNVDFDRVIYEIQANHNVVVINDDGDPYYPPNTHSGGVGISTEATKKFMIDYGSKWGLDFSRDFEPIVDQEGHKMVEFKSNPVPLEDALDLMHKMFNFINDIGDVSHGHAGLHTNMSIRGIKFDKEHFNPLKLLMLVDNEMIHDFFPVRTHVGDVFGNLSNELIFTISLYGGRDIIRIMKGLIRQEEKFQGINFQHMNLAGDTRRIEFRYTGGKDYTSREKIMRWTVYRFAYALEAAFDDDFLEKEYYREMIKFLDKEVKKRFNQFGSFEQMRSFVKKNEIKNTEELFSMQVGSTLKFDWEVFKHKDTDMILFAVADASWPKDMFNNTGKRIGTASRHTLEQYEIIGSYNNITRLEVVKKLKRI